MERNISVYSLAYLELNGNPLFRNNITNICNEVVLRVNTYLFLKCDYSQYDLPTSELD
jgi:hypothetical protein